jgi:hypothetical protein
MPSCIYFSRRNNIYSYENDISSAAVQKLRGVAKNYPSKQITRSRAVADKFTTVEKNQT